MKTRCLNPSHNRYQSYGGRGITIHPEWRNSFVAFYAYVGDPPSPTHTIDRIDPNGNYCPGNIRWATRKEQQSNRRNTLTITFRERTLTIPEWVKETGLTYNTIFGRYSRGLSPAEILKTGAPQC